MLRIPVRKLIAVAGLTVILMTAPTQAFNLDSLLIASVGGAEALDSLRHLTSYRAEGSGNLNGEQGRFIEYFVPPDRFYLEVRFPQFSIIQAYDGQTAWQQDHNGRVSQLEGFEKRELLKNLYFESCAYLIPGRLIGGREYRGETTEDGQCYHEVAFYPLNVDTVVAWYNCRTGLRKQMFSRLDNINTTTLVDDYREVSGILVPYYSRATCEGVDLFTEFKLETVELNGPIDESLFRMPSRETIDFHFPPGETSVEIPFAYRAGHIELPAVLNGNKKVRLILDSGSSASIFHKSIVEELHLPEVGKLPARGLGGFEEVSLVRTDSITIGALTLYDQVAGSLDLSLLKQRDEEEKFGGVLGYDFLSRFPVLIDYRDSTLVVYNPDGFVPPEGGVSVDFHLTMQVPTVRGELNGIPGDFIVDLGNAFGLIVHSKFAKIHDLEHNLDDVRENPGELSGIGGGSTGKTAYAATFQVGDVLIQSLRVILPDSSAGLAGSDQLAGNIGNLILENFKVLFDYKESRLIFYGTDT